MSIQSLFIRQFNKIDSCRKEVQFFYFFITLDLVFTGGILVTSLYPPIIAFLFPQEVVNQVTLIYNLIIKSLKIITVLTPFFLTFFLLDKALKLMIKVQKLERKLMQKIIERIFRWYYRKYRKDPQMPKFLQKTTRTLLTINTWLITRKVWQQYFLIIGLFLIDNPYLFYIFEWF